MSRATEDTLNKLHGMIAASITDELDRAMQRAAQHPDDPAYAVPASLQREAMNLLKMTGVTAPLALKKAEDVRSKLALLVNEDMDLDNEVLSGPHH